MQRDSSCQVPGCGRIEEQHRTMAHQFQPSNEVLQTRQERGIKQVVAADAVLRMLLVKKGFVTWTELKGVEDELRAAGLLGGGDAGYRSGGEGGRKVRDDPQA